MAIEKPLPYFSMNKPACIFDLDGVLVDTAKYHFNSWVRLADKLGFSLEAELEEQLKGISRMASLDIVLEHGGKQADEEERLSLATLKNQWYVESLLNVGEEVILPGVVEFINQLKTENVAIAVGSASKNAKTVLSKLGLDSQFVSIVDGNDVDKSKPDPEVFLNAARDLQYAESDCIVFEDSKKGLIAAKKGGFRAVGVGKEEILGEADFVINGFENIDYGQILSKLNFKMA